MSDGAVKYARNGDVHLAYRVLGSGEIPLVIVPGWVSNVDLYDDPAYPFAPLIEQLVEHTRLILWDKRGTGLSDPTGRVPTLDERMTDLHAVLDAAGVECPSLLGISEGGPMSLLFAATYPEHVRSMVLYGTAARFVPDPPDFPWGFPAEFLDREIRKAADGMWGQGESADMLLGEETASLPGVREMIGRYERASASPAMALMLGQAMCEIDVRAILPAVNTKTLVMGRPGDRMVNVEASEALAAALPNAEFRRLPFGAHAVFDDALAHETIQFVCGETDFAPSERVLATVLFTDIVGSTEQLSTKGDSQWRHHLDVHDHLVDRTLSKYGGRRSKHTGDGIFAMFDGPTSAARCALDLVPALATRGIRIRAGVHIGECLKRGDEWSGLAVHTGARIGAMAGPGEVLTSRTVRDLSVGSGLRFESLGTHQLKGLPDEAEVFRVAGPLAAAI